MGYEIDSLQQKQNEGNGKRLFWKSIFNSIQFNSIQFIDQLRALKGQQENCTYMNKQYAQ